MAKTNIIATIKTNNQCQTTKTLSIKTKEEYKYHEKDNTKVVFNYLDNYLKRENKQMILEINFIKNKETEAYYFIKELEKKLVLTIKTKRILKKDRIIEIEYTIDKDNYIYRIEEI